MTTETGYLKRFDYEIITPNGTVVRPPNGHYWRYSKEQMQTLISEGRVWFGKEGDNIPRLKQYLADAQHKMVVSTVWKYPEVGSYQEARQEVNKLFNNSHYFIDTKPIRLIKRLLQLANCTKSIVLDAFSYGATTAHTVMQLNAEDGGNRKFISIQKKEDFPENCEEVKDEFMDICEFEKERIRRAGKEILEEKTNKVTNLDIGFRVLKLD